MCHCMYGAENICNTILNFHYCQYYKRCEKININFYSLHITPIDYQLIGEQSYLTEKMHFEILFKFNYKISSFF